jgi:hypothetical protein
VSIDSQCDLDCYFGEKEEIKEDIMAKRFDVFNVKEAAKDSGKKSYWNKVGSAFENKDGSLSVHLDSLPLDGKLQIRAYVPKEDKGETFE